jgi:hypothetical protein
VRDRKRHCFLKKIREKKKKEGGRWYKRVAVGSRVAVAGWEWYHSIRQISAVILVVVWLRLDGY